MTGRIGRAALIGLALVGASAWAQAPADERKVSVLLGGGLEGYSGALAPALNPGPTWGVRSRFDPNEVIGLELAYSGAVNEIDLGRGEGLLGPGAVRGPDLVRTGAEAVALVGLAATRVQPYVLGGIGVSRYAVRGDGADGLRSDTAGDVPLGAGVRSRWGLFTADLRLGFRVLFDADLGAGLAATEVDRQGAGRYSATLGLGAAF